MEEINKRKRYIAMGLMLLASVFLFAGCGAVSSVKEEIRQILVEKQAEIYGEQFDIVSEKEKAEARLLVYNTDYGFSQLQEEEQELYLELLFILTAYQEERKLQTLDPDQVDKVYQTIMMDHPELFYLDGYTITKHSVADETAFYTFCGQYNRGAEEKEELELRVKSKAEEILRDIPADATDYECVKFIYEYIVRNTMYDEESEDNQNILSVFLNQASVCQGYAYATQYLLRELEIPCTTVTGTATNRDGREVTHAWNLVCLDGEYYYVDTTWGDPVPGSSSEAAQLMDEQYVNYDYLNLTTEQIERDHKMLAPVALPECVSEEHNYYRMEGLFYEKYDKKLVKEKTAEAIASGETALVMKFPDESVYQQYMNRLFEKQEIFQIVTGIQSISYTADPESFLLILYLTQD